MVRNGKEHQIQAYLEINREEDKMQDEALRDLWNEEKYASKKRLY